MSETVQTPEKKPAGMRPWLKVVLFTSLALNLAVAGVMIGAVVRFGPFDGGHPPRLDMVVGPYTHALSHQDRRAIGERLRDDYRAARPSREQVRAEFAEVLTALRAKPYDGDKVEAILMRQMKIGTERQERGQHLLIERLEQMSDTERAEFADRLEEGLNRHRSFKPDRD